MKKQRNLRILTRARPNQGLPFALCPLPSAGIQNPSDEFHAFTQDSTMPDILSQDEIDALLAATDLQGRSAISVLVVSDSAEAREALIARFGKTRSFNLIQVASTEDALKELGRQAFVLVCVDRELPKGDGLELVGQIRGQKKHAAVRILLMSPQNAKEQVLAAFESGADGYLLSPFTRRDLVQRVERLLLAEHPTPEIPKDRIDALPDEISQKDIDRLHPPPAKSTPKKARKAAPRKGDSPVVIRYDFKHPARVTKDQQRTLENLHANFARMAASSFSALQRSVVDVDIAFVDQTTYAEFIMSLNNPSCSYTFAIEPLGGPAIIDYSLPVTYSFINRQFGGSEDPNPPEVRPLSAIERSVMAQVLVRNLADLERTWEMLIKIQVSDAELETNPEFMHVAAPSDTVILIAFEVNTPHASGLVNLCYPYFTLEPVMPYLNVTAWAASQAKRASDEVRQSRLDALKTVETDLRVVLGRGKLSAEDVAGLQVGDTVVLDTRADDPAVVYMEDQPIFRARPGKGSGDNHAVELLQSIPPLDEFDPLLLGGRNAV